MKDFITGRTRTWPYGTTKAVEVVEVAPEICICVDVQIEGREGYIIIGGYDDEGAAKQGDKGTITFAEGGPTGGHWRYRAAAATPAASGEGK